MQCPSGLSSPGSRQDALTAGSARMAGRKQFLPPSQGESDVLSTEPSGISCVSHLPTTLPNTTRALSNGHLQAWLRHKEVSSEGRQQASSLSTAHAVGPLAAASLPPYWLQHLASPGVWSAPCDQ